MLIKKASVSRFLFLLPVLLVFGCSSHKTPGTAHQNGNLSKAAQNCQSNGEDALDPLALSDREKGEGMNNGAVASCSNDKQDNVAKKESSDENQNLLDAALELTEASQEYWADGEVEDSIEALDEAYALILKVETDDAPKLAQQKEDLRFVISKRIMELYASRHATVNGNYKEIPMAMNDHVEREIKQFQTVERDFFIEAYKRSGRYRQEMVQALKEAGLPEEISWLPLIESGFKSRALSRSRALGLWQFIPSTGYKFGLKRNSWIDERLDSAKATAAAIAYLKELHRIFGDWATVLAAYNCGEGSVSRVIRDQKINYLDNFWDFYERLPRETARYFPRFLAVLTILKDPGKYGFTLGEPDQPAAFEAVTIERTVHLKSVADRLHISLEELTTLNPELRRDATPDVPYALKVPSGKKDELLAGLDSMPKWSPPKMAYVFHRVRRGETLSLIALRYRTSIQKIMEANRMMRGHYIRVGQKLKIPLRDTT